MDSDLLLTLAGSAVTAAAVSGAIALVGAWRQRAHDMMIRADERAHQERLGDKEWERRRLEIEEERTRSADDARNAELRAAIVGTLESLAKREGGSDPERRRAYISLILLGNLQIQFALSDFQRARTDDNPFPVPEYPVLLAALRNELGTAQEEELQNLREARKRWDRRMAGIAADPDAQ
jgi:hypothetical protein